MHKTLGEEVAREFKSTSSVAVSRFGRSRPFLEPVLRLSGAGGPGVVSRQSHREFGGTVVDSLAPRFPKADRGSRTP
jgi:hypothetical protein